MGDSGQRVEGRWPAWGGRRHGRGQLGSHRQLCRPSLASSGGLMSVCVWGQRARGPETHGPPCSLAQAQRCLDVSQAVQDCSSSEPHAISEAASEQRKAWGVVAAPLVSLRVVEASCRGPGSQELGPAWSLPHQAWVLAEGGAPGFQAQGLVSSPDVRDTPRAPSSCRDGGHLRLICHGAQAGSAALQKQLLLRTDS